MVEQDEIQDAPQEPLPPKPGVEFYGTWGEMALAVKVQTEVIEVMGKQTQEIMAKLKEQEARMNLMARMMEKLKGEGR